MSYFGAWLVLCFVVGMISQDKGMGFGIGFFISLFLSPIVGLIIIAVSSPPKEARQRPPKTKPTSPWYTISHIEYEDTLLICMDLLELKVAFSVCTMPNERYTMSVKVQHRDILEEALKKAKASVGRNNFQVSNG